MKPIFQPDETLLIEILSGGRIAHYRTLPFAEVRFVLLEIHKSRREFNEQITPTGDKFIPTYIIYELLYGKWLPITYYRSNLSYALKEFRHYIAERSNIHKISQKETI